MNLSFLYSPTNKALFAILVIMVSFAHGVSVYNAIGDNETLLRLVHLPFIFFISGVTVAVVAIYEILRGRDPSILGKRVLYQLPTLLLLFLIVSLSCGLKSQINFLNPYYLDPFLIEADRFFHFGKLPQQWLVGIYDNIKALAVIDWFYAVWFFAIYIYAAIYIFIFRSEQRRFSFVVSFALIWFLFGNVLATIFSSVGPVFVFYYYPDITSPYTPFIHKMDYGSTLYPDLYASRFRAMLLNLQIDKYKVDMNAPSATPSVHVALGSLMFFHSWKYARRFSYILFAYLLTITAGAVILFWHYAVEVYAVILATYALWIIVDHAGACFSRTAKEDRSNV